MEPRLRQALLQIATQMQASNPAVAQQLQQFVQSNGSTPLPPAVMTQVEPLLRPQGLSLLNTVAGSSGNGRLGPGAQPAIQHNAQGQPVGYVAGDPRLGATVAGMPEAPETDRLPPIVPPRPGAPPNFGGGQPSETSPESVGLPRNLGSTYNTRTLAEGSPTGGGTTGGGTGGGNPGGFNAGVANALGEDDDFLLRFALQSAGFDPDVMTPAEKIAAKYLAPMVQARRAAYGLLDQSGGNKGGLPQDIAAFAKEYSDKGANFYGNAANYAKQILGGAGMANIKGIGDQEDRMGMYQALLPLLYGGANPMVQQSVADQTKKLFRLYRDQDYQQDSGKHSIFEDWLAQQQGLSPVIRSIFGMR